MSEEEIGNRPNKLPARAGDRLVLLASIGVVLFLVLLPGLTLGTPVVVKKPPFVAAKLYTQVVARHTSGCNSSFVRIISPPSFNATSGVAQISAKISARLCAGNSIALSLLAGYVGMSGGVFHVATTGRYNVSAFWAVQAGVTISAFFNGSPSAGDGGWAQLNPNVCFLDLTANNSTCVGGPWFGRVISNSSVTTNISSSFSDIAHGQYLAAGHSYMFRTFIVYRMGAAATPPSAHAGSRVTVTLDMSSGTYGATLSSLVVSR